LVGLPGKWTDLFVVADERLVVEPLDEERRETERKLEVCEVVWHNMG